jgi:endonuclease/exonuclease/phosphatase family metal-dependent hydrolase
MPPILAIMIPPLLSTLLQGRLPETAPGGPVEHQGIRVLTWNIQGCAAGLDPVANELRRHHADIICLQEAEAGTARTNGANQPRLIAAKLQMHEYSAGSAFAKEAGMQQMAILTRQPLEKSKPLDAGTGRIYGVTGIARIDGRPVRVVSIHLTNRYWRGVKAALTADDAPVREVTDLARRLEAWGGTVILAGDFNAVPGMREHSLIAQRLHRVPTTQPTHPANNPRFAIDHIYHSSDLRPIDFKVIKSSGSDHRPVLADLDPAATTGPSTQPPTATAPAPNP